MLIYNKLHLSSNFKIQNLKIKRLCGFDLQRPNIKFAFYKGKITINR